MSTPHSIPIPLASSSCSPIQALDCLPADEVCDTDAAATAAALLISAFERGQNGRPDMRAIDDALKSALRAFGFPAGYVAQPSTTKGSA